MGNGGVRVVEGYRQTAARDNLFEVGKQVLAGEVIIPPAIKAPYPPQPIREPVANLIEMISGDRERRIVWIQRVLVVIFAIKQAGKFEYLVRALCTFQILEQKEIE